MGADGVYTAAARVSPLTDAEFERFRRLLHRSAGVALSPAKKGLVAGRLAKRIGRLGLTTYGDYYELLTAKRGEAEMQVMLDLLTTHETHFFREPQHFDFLRERVLPGWEGRSEPVRAWSAACSTGEEPYTLAMVLADGLERTPWEILATDISTGVLERAAGGLFPMERAREIPAPLLRRHCLRGVRSRAGTFLVDERLRRRMQFRPVNLTAPLPDLGRFDLVLLRNVLIYFDAPTKRAVVSRVVQQLAPGGWLLVGHSETLHGSLEHLRTERPSVYQRI